MPIADEETINRALAARRTGIVVTETQKTLLMKLVNTGRCTRYHQVCTLIAVKQHGLPPQSERPYSINTYGELLTPLSI